MTRRPLRSAACAAALAALLAACSSPAGRLPWSDSDSPPAAPAQQARLEPVPESHARPAPRPRAAIPRAAAKPAPEHPPADRPLETPKLVGLSEAETVALLGPPAEQAEQAPGKVFTYRMGGCALAVHLFPDMDAGGYFALDYTADGDGPREACLRRAAEAHRKAATEGG